MLLSSTFYVIRGLLFFLIYTRPDVYVFVCVVYVLLLWICSCHVLLFVNCMRL